MRLALGAVFVIGAAFTAACTDEISEDVGTTSSAVSIPRVPMTIPQTDLDNLPGDLRSVAVPKADFSAYVKDSEAAIRLGKALFWDMQVGSDGKTACATCHFRAGADPRSKNQLSPGSNGGTISKGVNYQLKASDFPLTKLATPGIRGDVLPGGEDVVSSQGVHHLTPDELDPDGFTKNGINYRRVEPRNTPTIINAVFNHRQFWDGRAENVFNGVNHVGARDPNAKVLEASSPHAIPTEVTVSIENASLASQAVAPLLSSFEMAHPGRNMLDVATSLTRRVRGQGKRIACGNVRPLEKQVVSRSDSVLGDLARAPARGLKVRSYDDMVQDAFHDKWWNSKRLIRVCEDGEPSFNTSGRAPNGCSDYTLMQYNWALIFGIAVQMYEETLVSDDTPWDRFRRENPSATDPDLNPWTNTNPRHISRKALFGAHLFNDRTRGPTNIRCSNCHEQAELTDASTRRVRAATNGPVRNRDGNIIDKGFNNIGVRPTDDDLGVGGSDAFGPLSFTKRRFPAEPALGTPFDGSNVSKGFGVEGAFKIPSLRNVALTAPYFHNGEARTLKEAVEFYSRGGNKFPVRQKQKENGSNGNDIEPLGVPNLTPDEVDAIVAWLETLTDERVLYRKAPFDHPQIFVPNGHPNYSIDRNRDGLADDEMIEIREVGRKGGKPIPGFLEGPFGPSGSKKAYYGGHYDDDDDDDHDGHHHGGRWHHDDD